MTDGIIQEVFKLVIDRYKSKLPNPYFSEVIERTINDFELLQQELIERIKQADTKNPDWDYTFSIGVKLMKIYLIGDNND